MPEVTLHLWNLNRISALKYIHIKKNAEPFSTEQVQYGCAFLGSVDF